MPPLPSGSERRPAARSRRSFRTGAVDHLLELLAHLEEGRALGGDVHRLAGLGIPAFAGLANLHLEAPEAADLDALALAERLRHRVEDRVDHDLRVLLRDVRR